MASLIPSTSTALPSTFPRATDVSEDQGESISESRDVEHGEHHARCQTPIGRGPRRGFACNIEVEPESTLCHGHLAQYNLKMREKKWNEEQ